MQKRWWWLVLLIPLFYRPILGLLLVFLLPGLGFVLNLFKSKYWHERIALSIGLSLALVILNGFFLNLVFGLKFWSVLISLLLITLIPLWIYFKREKIDFKKIKFPKLNKKQTLQIVMLVFCLSVLAVKVYKPHFSNPYPIHLDEWSRLLETTHVIDEGSYSDRINPQFIRLDPATRRLNPGFQLILSQFYIVSGVDQIEFFQYLPMLFAVLIGFIVFSFLTKISNQWVGFFAIIFISLMRTNENTLGISYLVALTMTFPLLYALMYSLYNAFQEKTSLYLLLASFLYFAVLVIHEQTGASFFPIILLYIIVSSVVFAIKNRDHFLVSVKGIFIVLASLIVPIFSLYVAKEIIWEGSFAKSWEMLLELFVWKGTSQIIFSYNFILFYGVLLAILAVIGAILIFKNLSMLAFLVWAVVDVWQVMNFRLNQVTYFSSIARIRHHAVLGLIPLSAFALYFLLDKLLNAVKKNKEKVLTITLVSLLVIMSVFSLTYVDTGRYLPEGKRPKSGSLMDPPIDYKDYQAILFLKEISSKQVVLADPMVSAAIYPISKNYIVASYQVEGDGFGGGRLMDVSRFFNTPSCLDKQIIAYQNSAVYVLSHKPINCDSFKQIYSENARYIYELE
ncbi:DUF1616 domain-containing protein [Candidatus Woesearchaeota archaeon]|nr:DUF1616 domain-containing protein [Candidatus Woesearchaeota archaeon]